MIGGLFVWFSSGLNAASDDAFGAMLGGAAVAHAEHPARRAGAAAAAAAAADRQPEPLYVFLKPEIDQGLVTVLGTHAMPIVRIRNTGMFPSGSATVSPSYMPLLQRIGAALKAEKGPVQVIGYTDNQPIHTVQFPSNFQLSKARAEAASAIIVARRWAIPPASPRKGARTPIRSHPTPRAEGRERRTGASKSVLQPARRAEGATAMRCDVALHLPCVPLACLTLARHRRMPGLSLVWFFGAVLLSAAFEGVDVRAPSSSR